MPELTVIMLGTEDGENPDEVTIQSADKVIINKPKDYITFMDGTRTVAVMQKDFVKGIYLADDSSEEQQFTVEEKAS
jgi:hypothetical protein